MGIFIAIEGGDGSGKGTQAKILAKRASDEGYEVYEADFPQYGTASAKFAEKYLNGTYGEVNDVHPDLASLTYAVDRYAASEEIRNHLQKPNCLVIANRYVASNLAHQGTKIEPRAERKLFYESIKQLEFDVLGIPQPDLSIVLLVPAAIAQANVDKKGVRGYTTKKRDIHEASAEHLERAKENYEELTRLYPNEFEAVECMEQTVMRSIESIHEDIWKKVNAVATSRTKEPAHDKK